MKRRLARRGLTALAAAVVTATAVASCAWAEPSASQAGAARPPVATGAALPVSNVSDLTPASVRRHGPTHRHTRGHHRRVLLSPRPGQRITRNTVHIVVRAGDEADDVKARLNGTQIGQYFDRAGHGKRVLDAGAGIGLRHGANVLTVTASHGGPPTGHAVLHFTVRSRRPLVGSTPTLRVPVGSVARIPGTVRVGATRVDGLTSGWEVVAAPTSSAFVTQSAVREPATSHQSPTRSSSIPWQPLTPVQVPLASVGPATAPVASFRPDVLGTYMLRISASGRNGGDPVTKQIRVDAVPDNPVISVDTNAVAGGVPGIQLGDTVYPAPPMSHSGDQPVWSGDKFHALWQLLAVDRTTLAVRRDASGQLWNRTYGVCDEPSGHQVCRLTATGLQPADIKADLGAFDSSTLVIGASQEFAHPNPSQQWGAPDELGFATGGLSTIGFPSDPSLLNGATADSAAVIGVPGLPAGQANYDADPGGTAVIQGYLTSDANQHFHFVPSERVTFDTNAAPPCVKGAKSCTVTQRFGSTDVSGSLPSGQSGYVVSVLNSHGLGLWQHQTFVTNSPGGAAEDAAAVAAMATFIKTWAFEHEGQAAGNLMAITSVGAGASTVDLDPAVGAQWTTLAAAVVSIGGTLDTFNRSALAGSPYSLLGWGGAGAAQGYQATSGRLRGALVPNQASLSRPVNVSADAAPAEILAQVMVRKPVTTWPLDDDPGAHAAFQWIGSQFSEIGPKPRQAYWDMKTTLLGKIADDVNTIEDMQYPDSPSFEGQAFTKGQFRDAQDELVTELKQVKNVNLLLRQFEEPQRKAGDVAWQHAMALQDALEADLTNMDKKAKTSLNWFNLVTGLLNLTAVLAGLPGLTSLVAGVKALGASTQLAGTLASGNYAGGTDPQDRRVEADELGEQIEREAQDAGHGFDQMYDMIVSDPTKLRDIGTHAPCNPDDGQCGPHGEYDQFGNTDTMLQMENAMAVRSVDRVLHKKLVPLAFPVWDTGPGWTGVPGFMYTCEDPDDDPFVTAPAAASAEVMVSPYPDPAYPGSAQVEDYLMVANSGLRNYTFPDKATLERMFGPVSQSDTPSAGGLGMEAVDFLPYSDSHYVIHHNCGWM